MTFLSDFIIAHGAVILLLLPVVLRSFFPIPSHKDGLALLTLPAFCVATGLIIVFQIHLLTVILWILTIFILFSNIASITRFFQHLQQDRYSLGLKIVSAIHIFLLIGYSALIVLFFPHEFLHTHTSFYTGSFAHGLTQKTNIFEPCTALITNTCPKTLSPYVFIFLPENTKSYQNSKPRLEKLAKQGQCVIAADFFTIPNAKKNILSSLNHYTTSPLYFYILKKKIKQSNDIQLQKNLIQQKELELLALLKIIENKKPIVLATGLAKNATENIIKKYPHKDIILYDWTQQGSTLSKKSYNFYNYNLDDTALVFPLQTFLCNRHYFKNYQSFKNYQQENDVAADFFVADLITFLAKNQSIYNQQEEQ